MPRQIGQEAAAANGSARIGIELEGVGTVTTKWVDESILDADNFHDVFKRTPLVRSNSFNAGRGVYITPEDSGSFGKSGPAELVSSPPLFNVANLNHLRNSVKKALKSTVNVPNPARPGKTKTVMNPMRSKTHDAALHDDRLADDDAFQGTVATTRWAANPQVKIAGSLQTTIGVAVGKLLNNSAATRTGVVNLLVGDANKRGYVKDLLKAAISAQGYLTAAGNPLNVHAAAAEGIRLAVFMYLANFFAAEVAGGAAWTKTAYGANFKGYSSFVGCNVAANNDILTYALTHGPKNEATVKTEIVAAMEADHVAGWITDGLDGEIELDKIGKPGLSLQTDVEKWFSIPNFTRNARLYTVVESREKTSILNIKMCEFLNGSQANDAQTFFTHVSAHTLV